MSAVFKVGDVFDRMSELEDDSVDLVLTSPPFGWLRSYLPADHPDKHREIGSEPTPADYLDVLLRWTAECRRVLAPHGSLAVELGDTYAGSGGAGGDYNDGGLRDGQDGFAGSAKYARTHDPAIGPPISRVSGTRGAPGGSGWPLAKSLVGVPQLYMLSLAYGRNILTGQESPAGMWRVRNVKPWIRTNPPVGALGDKERPATSYVIVACTSANRYFDLDAVRTPYAGNTITNNRRAVTEGRYTKDRKGADDPDVLAKNMWALTHAGAPPRDWWHQVDAIIDAEIDRRAKEHGEPVSFERGNEKHSRVRDMGPCDGVRPGARGVHIRRALEAAGILTTLEALDINPKGYAGAHYAVWPPELCRQLIDEMCPPGGTVLDPFVGSGTTLAVASGMARHSIGIDIDPRNADLARARVGMFLEVIEREVSA